MRCDTNVSRNNSQNSVNLYIVKSSKVIIMKRFVLINDGKEITFNFPTSLEEISEVYLKSVTHQIRVADHYVLVALVYHESIGRLILARKQSKKSITSGVTPVFIKCGDVATDFIKSIKTKDKLIVGSQQLSLAQHVVAPKNTLSIDYFVKYLDKDVTVASRYNNNYGNEECFLVEFKILSSADIMGFYSSTGSVSYNNPYFNISECQDDSDESSSSESC